MFSPGSFNHTRADALCPRQLSSSRLILSRSFRPTHNPRIYSVPGCHIWSQNCLYMLLDAINTDYLVIRSHYRWRVVREWTMYRGYPFSSGFYLIGVEILIPTYIQFIIHISYIYYIIYQLYGYRKSQHAHNFVYISLCRYTYIRMYICVYIYDRLSAV